MRSIQNSHKSRLLVIAGAILCTAGAMAGDIYANYSFAYGGTANFTMAGPPTPGSQSVGAVQFQGSRTGGTDTLVPQNFAAYCVELTEHIGQGNNHHPDVFPLLGSTTNAGGVFFDATRTTRLECLWGTFFPLIGTDANLSTAFQLAQWELTFDNDADLNFTGVSNMWVTAGQFQGGITDVAQSWLDAIRNGTATQKQSLVLLSGEGIQDLITPVPEPASFLALGLGGAMVALRRRKKA